MGSDSKRRRPRRYAIIGLGFAERLASLSHDAQLLVFCLATSRLRRSVPGVVPIGEAGLAEALRWPPATVRTALAEAELAGVIERDATWPLLFVPAALEDDPPANHNVLKAWDRDLAELPASPLVWRIRAAVADALDGQMAEQWRLLNGSWNGMPNRSGNGSGNGMANPVPVPTPVPTPVPIPERVAPAALALPRPEPEQLQELWNSITTAPIPRCLELTATRRKQAAARLQERGLNGMRKVFEQVNAQAFCRGENERGWRASFDWAIKPANITKLLEGTYASAQAGARAAPRALSHGERSHAEAVRRAWGGCRHEPRCQRYEQCLRVIALGESEITDAMAEARKAAS